MADWYAGSVQYTAVTARANTTGYVIGDLRKPAAPAAGNERVFRCTTAGTSAAAEPATFGNGSVAVGGTVADGTAVWTEVTGNATYNWTAPHATLENAFARHTTPGERYFLADDHAQTRSASDLTLTCPGTAAAPSQIICVRASGGSIPPVAADLRTTATINTTGARLIHIATGVAYWYGVKFNASNGATGNVLVIAVQSANQTAVYTFDTCQFNLLTTNTTRNIYLGSGFTAERTKITMINCGFGFAATAQNIILRDATVEWKNTATPFTSLIPTSLFNGTSTLGNAGLMRIQGVDLTTLVGNNFLNGLVTSARYLLLNCQLSNLTTLIAAAPTSLVGGLDVISSGIASFGKSCRQDRYRFPGTLTTEQTIVRTGGATDGTTPISWKVVTNANAKTIAPFECFEIGRFNAALGSPVTATIEIVNDGVTLKDDEIWVEFQTLDDSGEPICAVHSTGRATPLTAGANVPTSTAPWTTTGLASPTFQKMAASFTPAMAGAMRAVVYVGRASQTVYIDPKITIS